MIGLALVTFVAVLSNSMKASNRGAIEEQIAADFVVTSQDGFTPFVAGAGEAAAQADGVELATSVRAEVGKVAGIDKYVTGVEPDKIAQVYNFDWADGSDAVLADLGRTGAIVDADFAEDHNLQVGDRFDFLSGRAGHDARGQGDLRPAALLPAARLREHLQGEVRRAPRPAPEPVHVHQRRGRPDSAAQAPIDEALATFPDAKAQTREAWITEQDEEFNQFLTMLYVLLALSVIISIFGMINTLALAVFERTRELGMLRAVGMTRWQARTMIGSESVITALIGAAIGLPLGMFLAALVIKALEQYDVRYDVPLSSLIIFAILAVIVGMVAAILPRGAPRG